MSRKFDALPSTSKLWSVIKETNLSYFFLFTQYIAEQCVLPWSSEIKYEKDIETNFCLTPLDSYKIAVQQFFAQRIPVITILWHRTVAHSWLILHHKLCYAEFIFDLLSSNSIGTIIRVLGFCAAWDVSICNLLM